MDQQEVLKLTPLDTLTSLSTHIELEQCKRICRWNNWQIDCNDDIIIYSKKVGLSIQFIQTYARQLNEPNLTNYSYTYSSPTIPVSMSLCNELALRKCMPIHTINVQSLSAGTIDLVKLADFLNTVKIVIMIVRRHPFNLYNLHRYKDANIHTRTS